MRAIPDDTRIAIAIEYECGYLIGDIAMKYRCSEASVCRIADQMGIPLRRTDEQRERMSQGQLLRVRKRRLRVSLPPQTIDLAARLGPPSIK